MTTILVDQDLCTRCGICSVVCTMGIIDPADENTLPKVQEAKAGMCIRCGHCEAYCPSQALLLNDRPDEKVPLPAGAGTIASDEMGYYLKKRRSVRHFTKDPVPKEKILEVLDIARYAASGGNGQPVEWIVVHDPKKVQKIAGLTIEWMKTLVNSPHPMSGYIPVLIGAWESGNDVICRGAPHLLVATIPEGNPMAHRCHHRAYALRYCRAGLRDRHLLGGICRHGCIVLRTAPERTRHSRGRKFAYAMMFGNPQYTIYGIPRRKPLRISWR